MDRAWATLVGLCLLFLVPLWLPTFLPFVDYACRADELWILAELNNPEHGFDRWYEVDRWLHPKMAHRMLLLPFAKAFGGDVALRLYYSAYLLGAPLAVAFALRQGGRPIWPALLVLPGLYSFPVAYGFGAYSVSTAALVFTFGCWERWREGITGRAWAGLSALSALLFLLHPQAFLYWVVTGGALAITAWLSGRQTVADVAKTAASMGTGALLFWSYARVSFNYKTDATRSEVFVWSPGLGHRLKELPGHLGAYWDDSMALAVLAATAVVIGVAAVVLRGEGGWRDRLWGARWAVVVAAFLGGAFAIPEAFGRQHFIASRFPSMAMLVVPLALGSSAAWSWPRLRGALLLIVALTWISLTGRMVLFDTEAARMSAVIDHLPDGATTQCNVDLRWTLVNDLPAYDCACSWIHLENGGLNGYLPHRTGIDHKDAWDIPGREYGSWRDNNSAGFHYGTWGNQYSHWVVRADVGPTELEGPRLGPYFERSFEDGNWRVYRRVRDFPPGFNVPGLDPRAGESSRP